MRAKCFLKAGRLMVFSFLLALILAPGGQSEPKAPPASGAAMACRALEVKTAEQLGVALVVFHQAQSSDGARLGELLRENDGAAVEFETSDTQSHRATVFRLGTCFGRGLLVFPAGSARLSRQEQFWLRFPEAKSQPANP